MSRMGLLDFNVLQPSHILSADGVAISGRSRLEGQLFYISYPVNAFAWLSRYSLLHGWAALSISITFQRQTLKCQPMMEALKLRLNHCQLGLQRSSILSVALSAKPIIVGRFGRNASFSTATGDYTHWRVARFSRGTPAPPFA
jgi:hypothetical protein